jgi:hypothetical protein
MAIGTPVAGTVVYSASADATSISPSYPSGMSAGQAVVLLVGFHPSTDAVATITTPAGFTLQGNRVYNAGGSTGVDVNWPQIATFTKDLVTGSESGALALTIGNCSVAWAVLIRVPKLAGSAAAYAYVDGRDSTGGDLTTDTAFNGGDINLAATVGDMVIFAASIPTNAATFSAQALSESGLTFGTAVELVEAASAVGNHIGGFVAYASVTAGAANALPTASATVGGTATNAKAAISMLRIREIV